MVRVGGRREFGDLCCVSREFQVSFPPRVSVFRSLLVFRFVFMVFIYLFAFAIATRM